MFQLNATALRLRLRSRTGYQTYNLPIDWTAPTSSTTIKNCWVVRREGLAQVYFIDPANVLWRLPYKEHGSQPTEVKRDVVAGMMVDGALRYWVADDNALIEYRLHQSSETLEWCSCPWPEEIDVNAVRDNTAPIYVTAGRGKVSVVAISTGVQLFYLRSKQPKMKNRVLPNDLDCRGITMLEEGLVAVGYNAERNLVTGYNVKTQRHRSAIQIDEDTTLESLCTAPSSTLIAFKTKDGAGCVANFDKSKVILRFGPNT